MTFLIKPQQFNVFLFYFSGCYLVIFTLIQIFFPPPFFRPILLGSWSAATWWDEAVKLVSPDWEVSKQDSTLTAVTAQIVGL